MLFNTRNMLKNKNKYMVTYRLEVNEMQSTSRQLRNQVVEQQSAKVLPPPRPPPLALRPHLLLIKYQRLAPAGVGAHVAERTG